MILENGVIRTMDPSLPTTRALAIAGAHVAGGVGTHELALPGPDVVDLGGRCVLPGFTDSHVHFPTWSLSQREVKLEGVTGLADALERVRAHPRHGSWIRGYGWRSAEWAEQPTAAALDAVTGETPALLFSKDYHSAWLNSAALARAEGDLQVDGGVVERDEAGRPNGILREESAWQFRARVAMPTEDEFVEATREGLRIAASRGVVAIHDKDGWLGAPGIFQRVAERDGLTLRVWGSVPYERLPELEALGIHSGIGDDFLRIGYLKAFMDGTLGSQTAWMLDGSGVLITSGEELAEVIRRGRAPGLARRRARDRRPGEPRGARRVRVDPRRVGASRACGIESSTRSASRRRMSAASQLSASRARCSSATLLPIATSPSASGPSRPTARTRSARCGSRGRSSRTARTPRSKSWIPSRGSAPACDGRSTSGRPGIPSSA